MVSEGTALLNEAEQTTAQGQVLMLLRRKELRIMRQEPLTSLLTLLLPPVLCTLLLIQPDSSEFFCALVALISFALPVALVLRTITLEKQLRLKEHLLTHGVTSSAYYASVLIMGVAVFSFVAFWEAIILGAGLFDHSDFLVVALFILLFAAANFAFTLTLAPFFWNARVAAILGPLVFVLSSMVSYAFLDDGGTGVRAGHTASKFLASALLPSVAMYLSVYTLAEAEDGNGIHWGEGLFSSGATRLLPRAVKCLRRETLAPRLRLHCGSACAVAALVLRLRLRCACACAERAPLPLPPTHCGCRSQKDLLCACRLRPDMVARGVHGRQCDADAAPLGVPLLLPRLVPRCRPTQGVWPTATAPLPLLRRLLARWGRGGRGARRHGRCWWC